MSHVWEWVMTSEAWEDRYEEIIYIFYMLQVMEYPEHSLFLLFLIFYVLICLLILYLFYFGIRADAPIMAHCLEYVLTDEIGNR